MSRRSWGFRNVRCPEQLDSRAMLAGNGLTPFAFGSHHLGEGPGPQQSATQFVSSAIAGQTEGHARGFASLASHSASDETSFTATLTDSTGTATGTATYSTQTSKGNVETTFSVSVTGATANTTFDVAVGATVVGQLTTTRALGRSCYRAIRRATNSSCLRTFRSRSVPTRRSASARSVEY